MSRSMASILPQLSALVSLLEKADCTDLASDLASAMFSLDTGHALELVSRHYNSFDPLTPVGLAILRVYQDLTSLETPCAAGVSDLDLDDDLIERQSDAAVEKYYQEAEAMGVFARTTEAP